ncbi:MAG: secondary thiamine-phosphate synthase enzyme YjbQ [Desertifilum sp.]|nr:secondary thiamine-phosphate synthase enzyme YjbQ [Desertifilum sp.]
MNIKSELLNIETETGIQIYNLTPQVQDWIERVGLQNGQITLFSRHTTTALAINEYEERLLVDIKAYLNKLAPKNDRYLHNDLHLRVVPPDEPMNAHSHLMAMTLSTSEVIPVIDSKLALGTWQSLLFFELDGPRQRTVLVQALGEFK